MKKIYLITFHRAQSYGAFLQAYALQNCEVLSEYQTEYIDYCPKRFSYKAYALNVTGSNILIKILKFFPNFVAKTRMHCSIQKFVKKYLKITDRKFKSLDDLKKYEFDGNIFVSGSDQVWDVRYDSLNNILPYYLSFTNGKKISYSSSCGEMNFAAYKDSDVYKILLGELSKFSAISVREEKSADELNTVNPKLNAANVLDPTFLINGNQWLHISSKFIKKNKRHYIFVYGLYRNKELHTYAQKLAQKYSLKIINVCDMLDWHWGEKNIFNINPFLLINLINGAEHVVTDSFHGCAYSINLNKQLHVFMSKTSTNRIENLVHLFGIENRIVSANQLINGKMDYSIINERLEELRTQSTNFLMGSLGRNQK